MSKQLRNDGKPSIMGPLLPCPFCGTPPMVKFIGNEHTKKRAIRINCPVCRIERTDGAIQYDFDWLEGIAQKNWNQRTEKPNE